MDEDSSRRGCGHIKDYVRLQFFEEPFLFVTAEDLAGIPIDAILLGASRFFWTPNNNGVKTLDCGYRRRAPAHGQMGQKLP
jgi:hypothetical protein